MFQTMASTPLFENHFSKLNILETINVATHCGKGGTTKLTEGKNCTSYQITLTILVLMLGRPAGTDLMRFLE